jgi:hypothetical protein
LRIIKGIVPAPRRILLYGQHGVGKSSWAAKAPKPIYVNVEDGLCDLDVDKTPVLRSSNEVYEALMWLGSPEDHGYKTVVVDTLDWFERLIHKAEVEAINDRKIKTLADVGFGKGYPRAIPHWDHFLRSLDHLRRAKGMTVVLLAHAKEERVESPEMDSYDRYSIDLHKTASGMLQEWCDEVLFASFRVNTRTEETGFGKERKLAVGGKHRFIRTNESASCIAKNRLGLPDELPMEWDAYAAHMRKPVARPVVDEVAVVPVPQVVEQARQGNIEGLVVDGSSKTIESSVVVSGVGSDCPF